MPSSSRLLLLLPLWLTLACHRPPLRTLPEVSRDLQCRPVLELGVGGQPPWLAATPTAVLLLSAEGVIRRYDPQKEIVDAQLQAGTAIGAAPLLQDDRLVCGVAGKWLLVDTAAMRVVRTLSLPDVERVVALGGGLLAGLGGSRLSLVDSGSGRVLWSKTTTGFVDARFGAGELLVLEESTLRRIDREGREQSVKLPFRATSPFLLDGRSLYVAADARDLVKLALPSGRVAWRRRLGMPLRLRPERLGRLIAVAPEDQNVWFFNRRGSVVWWQAQNSMRRSAPLVMGENVAVPLFSNSMLYLRPRRQERQPFALPAGMSSAGMALCQGALFYAEPVGETAWRMMRLGNRIDAEVALQPGAAALPGATVRLEIRFFNLPRPETRVRIEDAAGVVRLDKTIPANQPPLLVWVAAGPPGPLKAVVSVRAGEVSLTREKTLQLIDPRRLAVVPLLHL